MPNGEEVRIDPPWCFKYLAAVVKLTDKKHYDVVVQAVEDRNVEFFREICGEADIPEDLVEPLERMAFHPGPAARWFPT